jgi:cobalt-zinc-cadmium efflux system membrane fusion protein
MTSRHVLGIAALLLILGLAGCQRDPSTSSASEAGETEEEHEKDEAPTRTHIAAAMAEASGVRTAPAGPGVIHDEHAVQGLLVPIEGRYARVVARYPGPVRAVRVGIGETVRAGQTLAIIDSNASLSEYAVTAPIAGTVLARNVAVGDLAGDTPMFEIADLSALWVDLHLFGADAQHLRPGHTVTVARLADGKTVRTMIDRILPGTATASQSTVARATVSNDDGDWRPGAAVRAQVSVGEFPVALAVPLSAVQPMGGAQVVFVREGEDYEARAVTFGRRDARMVEVTGGLQSGDAVVVEESFLIKADIEKSSVEDDD